MRKTTEHNARIGIVLTTVPKYSETFFKTKILGLKNLGFEVLLFVEYQQQSDWKFDGKIVVARDYSGSRFKQILSAFCALTILLSSHLKTSLRHFRLDRKDGISNLECLKRLIRNEFLLKHSLNWLHFGFGMMAMGRENVAEAIGAKMAVSFRGSDLYLTPLVHPKAYDRLFGKNIKYHVLSHEMSETLNKANIKSKNIHIITPAIDIHAFKASTKELQSSMVQLTTIARLHWKKGLEYTLEALAILKLNGIKFNYNIIGEGPEYERLKFASHQLGLQDNVHFLGQLKPEKIRSYLNQTDIYLQYSIQEGFCNAVLEAQAMGCLCIVSNAEGLSENVIHGETGFVIEKRDPRLLANTIEIAVNLPKDVLSGLKAAAIDRVQNNFSLELQLDNFEQFYLE